VAELVDAHGSGPCGRKPVEVQVLSSAPRRRGSGCRVQPNVICTRLDLIQHLLAARRDYEIEQTAWTTSTTMLNWATGLALIAGGALLASFVASTA
jgi:hypothetical protein